MRSFSSPQGRDAARELLEDEREFIDSSRSSLWIAKEHPVMKKAYLPLALTLFFATGAALADPSDWSVLATLEQVFARRAERGATGRIQSLRYCASAVETAWQEVEALTAGSRRQEAPAVDVAARLEALSPLAVLSRGYAVVRRERDGEIVRRVPGHEVRDLGSLFAETDLGGTAREAAVGDAG